MTAFRRTTIRPLFQAKRTPPTGSYARGYGVDVQHGILVFLGGLHGCVLRIHRLEHGAYESVINKHLPRLVETAFSPRFLSGTTGARTQVMY